MCVVGGVSIFVGGLHKKRKKKKKRMLPLAGGHPESERERKSPSGLLWAKCAIYRKIVMATTFFVQ